MTLSAVFNGDANQLADVRAVSEGYPLRGQLSIADRPFAAGILTRAIPAPGEAWPDSRLAAALGVGLGGELTVGARDAARDAHSDLAPRSECDLRGARSGAADQRRRTWPRRSLIQPGSRVELRAAARRSARAACCLSALAQPIRLGARAGGGCGRCEPADRRCQSSGGALPGAGEPGGGAAVRGVDRDERAQLRARHLDAVALMKTLGASRRLVLAVSLWQLLALAPGRERGRGHRWLGHAAVAGARTAGVAALGPACGGAVASAGRLHRGAGDARRFRAALAAAAHARAGAAGAAP